MGDDSNLDSDGHTEVNLAKQIWFKSPGTQLVKSLQRLLAGLSCNPGSTATHQHPWVKQCNITCSNLRAKGSEAQTAQVLSPVTDTKHLR